MACSIDSLPSASLTVKTIYKSFMDEKENLAKLEQQMNDKSSDQSNAGLQQLAAISDVESTPNQTVDILQELLHTIKQNNQLEVRENETNGRYVCTLALLVADEDRSHQTQYRERERTHRGSVRGTALRSSSKQDSSSSDGPFSNGHPTDGADDERPPCASD